LELSKTAHEIGRLHVVSLAQEAWAPMTD
jgi:hypothetical protein